MRCRIPSGYGKV